MLLLLLLILLLLNDFRIKCNIIVMTRKVQELKTRIIIAKLGFKMSVRFFEPKIIFAFIF